MEQNQLFNIENIFNFLKTVKKSNEYAIIKTEIPKYQSNYIFRIKKGISIVFCFYINYFLTYGILHEFLQLFNNTDEELFDYYCRDVFNKEDINEIDLVGLVCTEYKIAKNNIIYKNFQSENKFFRLKKRFKKGSYIQNITSCYNLFIPAEILNIFLLPKKELKQNFLIKLPNISSEFIIDVIKLLTNIFQRTILFKSVYDSFFNDSFYILCLDIHEPSYLKISKEIQENIDSNNIDIKKDYIKNLFLNNYENNNLDINNNFIIELKSFFFNIEILIANFLNKLIKNLNQDSKLTIRNPKNWNSLDFYKKFSFNKDE